MESCDYSSQISPNNFSHNNNFFQLNVNSIDSFNTNFKEQQESIAYQISNKVKNTNHNLDIEGLINSRKLYTNNPIIGYLNIDSLRNKITQLRKVSKKAPTDLCIDETKLMLFSQMPNFTLKVISTPRLGETVTKMVGGK